MEKTNFIDTHAHLDDPKYDSDRAEVIKRAVEAGVKAIINVGCWNKKNGFDKVAGTAATARPPRLARTRAYLRSGLR